MNSAVARPRVAFQGEHGAFSEDAALKLLGPDIELVPRRTFAELFRSLDEGVANYILAPVQNSLIGTIHASVQILQETSLAISGDVVIPIQQNLIGCRGALFEEIEEVESHPAALAQCERFFAANPGISRIESEDTAGSVARIVALGDRKRAAIAGRRAADLYGGSILKEDLQDTHDNYTRFLLLQAGSDDEVSTGSDSDRVKFTSSRALRVLDRVAIAPGTDLMTEARLEENK